ncbi:MAG: hypothetical protein ACI9OJ_004426, partial [Myxococcota bacterium]
MRIALIIAVLSPLLPLDAAEVAESAQRRTKGTPACVAPGLPAGTERALGFRRLNEYRKELGLNPVQYSKALELAADEHARDMFQREYVAHNAPDGGTPADRAVSTGFCHRRVGENVYWAMNRTTGALEPMNAWK